jgi:hypothetical protein
LLFIAASVGILLTPARDVIMLGQNFSIAEWQRGMFDAPGGGAAETL